MSFKPKDNVDPESVNKLARILAWYFSRRPLSLNDFVKHLANITTEELDAEFAKDLYKKYSEEIEKPDA